MPSSATLYARKNTHAPDVYGWDTPHDRPLVFVDAAADHRIAGPAIGCCGRLHPLSTVPQTLQCCGRVVALLPEGARHASA